MYETKKPKVIVFEGIDGAGKTSLIELAAQCLRDRGLNVKIHATIGDNPITPYIHENILDVLRPHGYMAECFAMLASHAETFYHCFTRIDSVNKPDVILVDRWYGSFYGYQLSRQDINSELVSSMRGTLIHYVGNYFHIRPDALVYVDVNPDVARSRIEKRGKRNDMFEAYSIYLSKIRQKGYELFLEDAKSYHWFERIIRIENSAPLNDEYAEKIMDIIGPIALGTSNEKPEEIIRLLNEGAKQKPMNWIRKTH